MIGSEENEVVILKYKPGDEDAVNCDEDQEQKKQSGCCPSYRYYHDESVLLLSTIVDIAEGTGFLLFLQLNLMCVSWVIGIRAANKNSQERVCEVIDE